MSIVPHCFTRYVLVHLSDLRIPAAFRIHQVTKTVVITTYTYSLDRRAYCSACCFLFEELRVHDSRAYYVQVQVPGHSTIGTSDLGPFLFPSPSFTGRISGRRQGFYYCSANSQERHYCALRGTWTFIYRQIPLTVTSSSSPFATINVKIPDEAPNSQIASGNQRDPIIRAPNALRKHTLGRAFNDNYTDFDSRRHQLLIIFIIIQAERELSRGR